LNVASYLLLVLLDDSNELENARNFETCNVRVQLVTFGRYYLVRSFGVRMLQFFRTIFSIVLLYELEEILNSDELSLCCIFVCMMVIYVE
jgi:hypothetical protein